MKTLYISGGNMSKRIVFTVLGFVLILVGSTGIVLHQVNEQKQATLRELELINRQEEAKALAAEEQRKTEEERRKIEELAKQIEADKLKRVEAERRLKEEERKARQAELARRSSPEPRQQPPAAKPNRVQSAQPAPKKSIEKAPTAREPERRDNFNRKGNAIAGNYWQKSISGSSPKRVEGDLSLREIEERAGREAATLLKQVCYTNPKTGEMVRADPSGYGDVVVRVRVRTWEREDLLSDNFFRHQRFSRAY
jgi:hypothetical protein